MGLKINLSFKKKPGDEGEEMDEQENSGKSMKQIILAAGKPEEENGEEDLIEKLKEVVDELYAKHEGNEMEEEEPEEDTEEEDSGEAEPTNGKVEMPKEAFKKEHKGLVEKLKRQDPEELDDEAEEQEGELEKVKAKSGAEKRAGRHAILNKLFKKYSSGNGGE